MAVTDYLVLLLDSEGFADFTVVLTDVLLDVN